MDRGTGVAPGGEFVMGENFADTPDAPVDFGEAVAYMDHPW